LQETKYMAEAMGGTWSFIKYLIDTISKMAKYYFLSKKIRYRFKRLEKSKKILFRKKLTSKYVGYVLATGKK
ncbi:MAG TPA: class I SAM-dependent methyltransferase, partial [Methanosarcina vacuolata]|nr:class I SAM-dependent methyltransferase [Methanosarcina vacuolata]